MFLRLRAVKFILDILELGLEWRDVIIFCKDIETLDWNSASIGVVKLLKGDYDCKLIELNYCIYI